MCKQKLLLNLHRKCEVNTTGSCCFLPIYASCHTSIQTNAQHSSLSISHYPEFDFDTHQNVLSCHIVPSHNAYPLSVSLSLHTLPISSTPQAELARDAPIIRL